MLTGSSVQPDIRDLDDVNKLVSELIGPGSPSQQDKTMSPEAPVPKATSEKRASEMTPRKKPVNLVQEVLAPVNIKPKVSI